MFSICYWLFFEIVLMVLLMLRWDILIFDFCLPIIKCYFLFSHGILYTNHIIKTNQTISEHFWNILYTSIHFFKAFAILFRSDPWVFLIPQLLLFYLIQLLHPCSLLKLLLAMFLPNGFFLRAFSNRIFGSVPQDLDYLLVLLQWFLRLTKHSTEQLMVSTFRVHWER